MCGLHLLKFPGAKGPVSSSSTEYSVLRVECLKKFIFLQIPEFPLEFLHLSPLLVMKETQLRKIA